jgi:PKD repeat protein
MTPAPQAQFVFFPSQPSVFDTVTFIEQTYDPAYMRIQSETWDFGDGDRRLLLRLHQYATDGTYHVTLTIVTPDGRTDDTTQDVVVKTHDVAITDDAVPTQSRSERRRP